MRQPNKHGKKWLLEKWIKVWARVENNKYSIRMNEIVLHVFLCEELYFVSVANYNLTIAICIYVIHLNLSEEGKFYAFY